MMILSLLLIGLPAFAVDLSSIWSSQSAPQLQSAITQQDRQEVSRRACLWQRQNDRWPLSCGNIDKINATCLSLTLEDVELMEIRRGLGIKAINSNCRRHLKEMEGLLHYLLGAEFEMSRPHEKNSREIKSKSTGTRHSYRSGR